MSTVSNELPAVTSPVDTRAVSRRRPETIATVATFALAVLLVLGFSNTPTSRSIIRAALSMGRTIRAS